LGPPNPEITSFVKHNLGFKDIILVSANKALRIMLYHWHLLRFIFSLAVVSFL